MQQIPCEAFRKNPDGSWTCIKPVTISGPNGTVKLGAGMTFSPGVAFMGVDLAKLLEEHCT